MMHLSRLRRPARRRRLTTRELDAWLVQTLEQRTLLAATFAVDTTVDSVDANPGDGVAEDALGRTSLRAAVMEANALAGVDTIQLPPGNYQLTLTGAESEAANDLDVTSGIILTATGGGLTTIDALGNDRVIHVSASGELTVEGVGMSQGDTPASGGGIFNDGGIVRLVNATVSGNTATTGGGIANSGELHIDNSTISGNTGGGIHNMTGGTLHIVRSTVTDNTDDAAAGIANAGTVHIMNTIVAGNTGTLQNTDVVGDFLSSGHNLVGKAGAGVTGFGNDQFVGTEASPISPQLDDLADNGGTSMTHALLPGSVAIDAGRSMVDDVSGNGNSGTIVGDVVSGEGVLGNGAHFPGGVGDTADDFVAIDLNQISPAEIPTAGITVAAWAKLTSTGFRHAIFASQTGSGEFITHAEVLPDGRVRFTLRDNSGNNIIDFIGGSVPFNTWFHYAATYDQAANEVVVYVDGTEVFRGPSILNASIGNDWNNGALIGSTTSRARPFTGQMDEFYLFTRALNSTEIATLATVPSSPTGAPQVSGDLSIYYSFDNLIPVSADQRGGPRVLDGDGLAGPMIDIGAYERFNDFNPDNPIPEPIQLGDYTAKVVKVAEGLVSPSLLVNAGDGSGRLFVSDQFGFVWVIKDGILQTDKFLDLTAFITDSLNGNQEQGLSGFTFHPDFADPTADGFGKFYTWTDELVDEIAPVDFTHFPLEPGQERAAQSVLREWTMNDITDDVFNGTTREILRIDQPHDAHSAGSAEFGPDGYLYLALGDGGTHDDQGPGHDPVTGNARKLSTIYGKILRIDPLGTNSTNGKYGIPATNPFVGDPEALDEIYFYGLRNPFRFSFATDEDHQKTTTILIGDAGQDHLEEVDKADIIDDAGGHFGWNLKEGTFLFDPGPPPGPGGELRIGATANSPGSPLGLIDPVLQYDHGTDAEGTAVIGGYVYQGDLIPALKGMYIFGDLTESFFGPNAPNGRIFYADLNAPNPEILEFNLIGEQLSLGGGVSMFIKGFGLDEEGEMYVVGSSTLASADNSGLVLKLTAPSQVIDNGDAGFATSGNWNLAPNASFPTPEGHEGDIHHASPGDGSKTASWTFSGLTAGASYELSATWSTHSNRATNAPFSILDSDGVTVLTTALVDQEQSADDFAEFDSNWERIGVVTITGTTLTVQLSNAANQYVIADAVRLVESAPPATPSTKIIDDGDAGFTASGAWNKSPIGEGRLNDVRTSAPGSGADVASWTFSGLTPGNYLVSATWSTHQNRATNAPYTIRDGVGGTILETVLINQELPPDDFTDQGSDWENLTVVSITGDTLVVELSDQADQFVIADAIRIESTLQEPLPIGMIIDNEDVGPPTYETPGFSTSGTWNLSPLMEGHNGTVRTSARGDGSNVATWAFRDLTPGTYRVSATWSTHANRATDAPYEILDGENGDPTTSFGIVDINQEFAPDDFTTFGSAWEDLMTVTLAGNSLFVRLTNDANDWVIADAIRIQPLSSIDVG